MKQFTLRSFLRKYHNDTACLKEIFNLRYPNGMTCPDCERIRKFYKIKGRKVYQCSCGFQVAPLAGTIFEKSTTPLQYWFYAIFLMANTRSGVSANQLKRELGVTYKTAWRMFKQIRTLMAFDGDLFDGVVEMDETYIGGKARKGEWGRGVDGKEAVFGMVERNGQALLKHVADTSKHTLMTEFCKQVYPDAKIYTDNYTSYADLKKMGYDHEWVNHSKREYRRGAIYTQNVENVWSHLKRGLRGVYRGVSKKYLQAYVDEYGWRYNNRKDPHPMFSMLLKKVVETK